MGLQKPSFKLVEQTLLGKSIESRKQQIDPQRSKNQCEQNRPYNEKYRQIRILLMLLWKIKT